MSLLNLNVRLLSTIMLSLFFFSVCTLLQTLRSFTFSLWTSFLRHPKTSQDPVLLSFLPRLTEVFMTTLYKVRRGVESLRLVDYGIDVWICAFKGAD